MTKPSTAQAKFMNAILRHGGDQVPGSKIFHDNELRDRREIKTVTIASCRQHGWVRRDERPSDQMALWTVTADGRSAMARAGRTRTEIAEELVIAAFVFVRKARAQGCTNEVTDLLFQEIATTRAISGDRFSGRTCRGLARQRAREMNELDLLAEGVRR